jgi:hypothetical protein
MLEDSRKGQVDRTDTDATMDPQLTQVSPGPHSPSRPLPRSMSMSMSMPMSRTELPTADSQPITVARPGTGGDDTRRPGPSESPSTAHNPSPLTVIIPQNQPLPSNSQLLDSLPTGYELVPLLARPSHEQVFSAVELDRNVLPSPTRIQALLQHFAQHTLPAFPIFHLPTLKAQVERVCFTSEKASPWDICAVLSR